MYFKLASAIFHHPSMCSTSGPHWSAWSRKRHARSKSTEALQSMASNQSNSRLLSVISLVGGQPKSNRYRRDCRVYQSSSSSPISLLSTSLNLAFWLSSPDLSSGISDRGTTMVSDWTYVAQITLAICFASTA
jgi:hypothetical protein